MEGKNWDIFRLLPPKGDRQGLGFWHDASLQVLKLVTFGVVFLLSLGSAVVAKISFVLISSAVGWGGQNMTICTDKIPESDFNTVRIAPKHSAKWAWALFLAVAIPELVCFVRSLHRTLFKNVRRPTLMQFTVVFIIETLHAIGVGILVFRILPDLDAITALMLMNAVCLVPACLSLISRRAQKMTLIYIVLDVLAIGAQSTIYWKTISPTLINHRLSLPISLTLISLAWWQNFPDPKSALAPMKALAAFASRLNEKRSKTYALVSLWKCCIYAMCLVAFVSSRVKMNDLMRSDVFGEKLITITGHEMNQTQIQTFLSRQRALETGIDYTDTVIDTETEKTKVVKKWNPKEDKPDEIDAGDYAKHRRRRRQAGGAEDVEEEEISVYSVFDDYVELNQFTAAYDALKVVALQAFAGFVCLASSKFACKVLMQRSGFALPMLLCGPVAVIILASSCSLRAADSCYLTSTMSKELFWRCGDFTKSPLRLLAYSQTWMWLGWLLSQVWVTFHLWTPGQERLARAEKLFILPYWIGGFVESLALNRRRDDKASIKAEDLEMDSEEGSTYETIGFAGGAKPPPSVCSMSSSKHDGMIRDSASSADAITKIYACATMWHETAHEMTCMLKSIFRMDEDQCARRNAQKYLKIIDPDYYEFEAHIFFDDAFDQNEFGEPIVNKYVKQIVTVMDDAASAVHQTQMRLKPPKKVKTPYGGRFVYILPGKNRLIIHLKDKNKIRHRKRWSQVMYLYYLLGYRLMMKVDEPSRKEIISENTFILTLDGDVDFTPQCVHLLVDLMKKNRRLGAACGRIHPRGSGLMVWYQKFEYAVGHWLQKATEHMIGCVLCSPGCFSLFRSYALMDDDVTRKYASKSDQPMDYIQYDQGEDRWLCTLLLQRGYRVEYCAASDAQTFAPDGFNEFFNQRRRWIPSTIANIFDLLKDYKNVVQVNESISIWYIFYQFIMLISSILGPGTIFLMIVGAVSISFNIDTKISLVIVALPVIFFCIVCLTAKSDKQLVVAQVIGCLFAMLMTAVIVGTTLQIQKDGFLSPHSIFLFSTIVCFLSAAILHPLEFTCILPGTIYFLAIPCMYMLLPIYSICNLNNITWGTREDPRKDEKNDLAKKPRGHLDILEAGMGQRVEGEFSFGCGSACRLMCCLEPDRMESSPAMFKLNEKLNEISHKLERIERRTQPGLTRRPSMLSAGGVASNTDKCSEADEDDQAELEDDLEMSKQSRAAMNNKRWKPQSDAWLQDSAFKRAEKDDLEPEEERFWTEVIEKYLFPISADPKEQERIRAGLIDLRNRTVSGFFMLNVVFIIVVLVLQLQKDCLHIEWPIGPKFNHTITPCYGDTTKEIWVMSRLQLEPIGLVFLVFFMSILVIQFLAMLMHRFGTLAHIIASTDLFCCKKQTERLSEDDLVVQNAVEIARELQAIRGVDEGLPKDDPMEEVGISRRRVVQSLEHSRKSMMKKKTETLDAAFKKRFFALSSELEAAQAASNNNALSRKENRLTMRKGTIRALEHRRDSLFGTIDKREVEEVEKNPGRGPAQRKLERLFDQPKTGRNPLPDNCETARNKF